MLEFGGDLDFAHETLQAQSIAAFPACGLERRVAVEAAIAYVVDDTHAAFAELLLDFEYDFRVRREQRYVGLNFSVLTEMENGLAGAPKPIEPALSPFFSIVVFRSWFSAV